MSPTIDQFSLQGGPLHRLGRRLGLVRGTNTLWLGLAIGGGLWLVVAGLALVEGATLQVFAMAAIGGHVRLLIVIPLLFYAESLVDPRARMFVGTIVRSRVVPPEVLSRLEADVARVTRWKEARIAEAACVLGAAVISIYADRLPFAGATASVDSNRLEAGLTLAGWYYWALCLPLFRFLLLRWVWHLGLWAYFLHRVARLDLHLVPTHPDRAAGLGYVETVQAHFAPLVLAVSALQSASLAEDLVTGRTTLTGILPSVALVLAIDVLLFVGPLLVFVEKLWDCQVRGLAHYSELASRYVSGFDRKWIGGAGSDERLLGTPDIQSLADLSHSVEIVRDMRLVPASMRLFITLGMAAVAPMLPLLLFEYPLADLLGSFLAMLAGV